MQADAGRADHGDNLELANGWMSGLADQAAPVVQLAEDFKDKSSVTVGFTRNVCSFHNPILPVSFQVCMVLRVPCNLAADI